MESQNPELAPMWQEVKTKLLKKVTNGSLTDRKCGLLTEEWQTSTSSWPGLILIQNAPLAKLSLALLLMLIHQELLLEERKSTWDRNVAIPEVLPSKTWWCPRKMCSLEKVLASRSPWVPSTRHDLL